jgi:hypothetical protein
MYWIVLAMWWSVCGSVSAANVVLKDGTVVHGEVEALQDGVYTVRTDSLGTVRVRKDEVRSIDEGGGSTRRSGSDSSTIDSSSQEAELRSLQLGIMQNPSLLAMLLALQNDPDVLAVLADPEIMKKIAAGDYTALMNDPKIDALMRDDKVRAIVDEMR